MSSCCNNNPGDDKATANGDARDQVRAGYTQIAGAGSLTSLTTLDSPQAQGGGCCGSGTTAWEPDQLARELGYDAEELSGMPAEANMGLSCGNPTAIAALRPGQVVLDLGSGGGFDCFLAGPKVGPTGRVIGVDMTPDMLSKARANIAGYLESGHPDNVEFRLGEIEHLPAADSSVDVVISNCVINLSPDKPQVWREIARVLRPGGRVAASDMALYRPLPDAVREDVATWIGCVSGAVLIDEYRAMIERVGLEDIQVTAKPEYIEALTRFKDPLYQRVTAALPEGASVADYVTSVDVVAVKA